jgi:hypothetical protein
MSIAQLLILPMMKGDYGLTGSFCLRSGAFVHLILFNITLAPSMTWKARLIVAGESYARALSKATLTCITIFPNNT